MVGFTPLGSGLISSGMKLIRVRILGFGSRILGFGILLQNFLEFHLYLREYKMRVLGDKRSLLAAAKSIKRQWAQ